MSILKHLWGIVAVVALLLGSVGLATVSAAPGFEWTVPMVADAGAEGSNSDIEFGIHTDATDGFDSGIDVAHPPPGPTPPPFDTYFSIDDMLFPQLYKDFRGAISNWTLVVWSTSNTINLSWDCTGVPEDVGLRLTNSGIDIDMKAQNNTTLPAGSHTLTIVATQVVPTYTLTMAVDPPSSGTATDETGTGPYEEGAQVSIKAQAAAGYQFVNWTAPAGTFANANAAQTTFTMPAQDVTVTAHFEKKHYTLTMAASPTAGGTATDETGGSPYVAGTEVNIKAVANTGYRFVNWTAPAGTFANANAAQTTFTMPTQAVTVTAHFVRVYSLTMARNPVAGGTATDLTGASPYPAGTPVSIKAAANPGYEFGSWTAPAGTFADEYDEQTYFTMPAQDVTVTANFVLFNAPGNVDLTEADPSVVTINVTSIDLAAVNTTNMPEDIEPQEVAYLVDSTGTGSFTLRFTDVDDAGSIVVYKVVDSTWTQIPPTAITPISATTVEVTMEVGDPAIVFGTPKGVAPPVGGTAHPINKLAILALWIALGAALIVGASLLILRRRRAQN